MQKTIRILLFDELDQLTAELQKLQEKYAEIDLHIASHVNDLIINLDDFQPHLVIVNNKLSSYEGLTALALLKRRRPGVPHVLLYDSTKSIKEMKQLQLGFGAGGPVIAPLIAEIESIIQKLSEQHAEFGAALDDDFGKQTPLLVDLLKEYTDLVFIINPQLEIQGWGRNEFAQISIPNRIMEGMPVSDMLPYFFDKTRQSDILNSLQSKASKEFELLSGPEEKRIIYSVKINPLSDGRKILTIEDQTIVKFTESALIQRTRLLEMLPWGVISINLDDRIVFCNQESLNIARASSQAVLGKSFEDAFPVTFPDENSFEIKRKVFEDGSWEGKIYIMNPESVQEALNLKVMLFRNTQDKVIGLLYILTRSEKDSPASYQNIIENISDGIFILSNDKIIYTNEVLGKMLGYSTDEMIDQSIFFFIDSEDIASFSENYSEVKEFLEVENKTEVRLIHKNGINRLFVELRLVMMQTSENINIMGVAHDVTEKKLHDLLFNFKQSDTVAGMNLNPQNLKDHDFRTFLNAILGFADILRDRFREYYDDQSLFLYAEQIHAAGHRMLRLLEDNPAVTELAASRAGVTVASADLNQLLDECLDELKDELVEKDIKISIAHNTKYRALADLRYFREVILNLLRNCIINSNSGFILLDTGFDVLKNLVFIRIKDSRESIDENILPCLFNPTADNPAIIAPELRDTSIAFIKAKRLMHIMNGRLEVSSTGGAKGLTLTLFLPYDERNVGPEEQKSNVFYTVSPELIYLNELHPYFLIIEDDPGSSKMLEVTLRSISRIELASNGNEAIEMIQQKYLRGIFYDLVLLDIGLPDPWNGMTLRQHILDTFPEYRKIPFIAETAFVTRTEKERIIESGFDGFISKPIDRRFLIKTLTSTLKRIRGET